MTRIRELLAAGYGIASYAVLGTVWAAIFTIFLLHMAPRIAHIVNHAPLADTPPCDAVQCDFSVFWPAGLLARAGRFQDIYHPAAFNLFRAHVLFAGEARLDWFYPPPSLLPVMLASYLPIGLGFLVWTVGLAGIGVLMLRVARISWPVVALALLSPAALWDFELGQWEFFCGASLAAGLLLQAHAPSRGGALLSLLIIKPQTGFAIPIGLLAGGRWRTILGGAAGGGAILGLTTVILGPAVWAAWMAYGIHNASQTLNQSPRGMEESISVFWMVRNFGAPVGAAYAAQAAAALIAAGLTWAAWRDAAMDAIQRAALTIFCGLLFTPYAYTSDMVAYEIALTLLAERRGWRIGALDALFWLWPMLGPALFVWKGWLLTPFVVMLAIGRELRTSRKRKNVLF